MVIAMRAAHFVSWGPLSAQDMGLVWLRHCMCSQKKEITHLFRKSLCIRMRISSLTRKLGSPSIYVSLFASSSVSGVLCHNDSGQGHLELIKGSKSAHSTRLLPIFVWRMTGSVIIIESLILVIYRANLEI